MNILSPECCYSLWATTQRTLRDIGNGTMNSSAILATAERTPTSRFFGNLFPNSQQLYEVALQLKRALTRWRTGIFLKTSAPLSLIKTFRLNLILAGSILLDSTFNAISPSFFALITMDFIVKLFLAKLAVVFKSVQLYEFNAILGLCYLCR